MHEKTVDADPGDAERRRARTDTAAIDDARSLVRAAGQRLVQGAAVAGRRQLRARQRHQRARDVAGRHVRPQADRHRARLGGGHRDEHDARVPPRPALAAGRRGLQEAAARVPRHRRQAPHQDDVRAVRFGVGSESAAGPAAGAQTRRPQLRLAPEPWRQGVAGPEGVTRASKPTSRASSASWRRMLASSPGTCGTSRTT